MPRTITMTKLNNTLTCVDNYAIEVVAAKSTQFSSDLARSASVNIELYGCVFDPCGCCGGAA